MRGRIIRLIALASTSTLIVVFVPVLRLANGAVVIPTTPDIACGQTLKLPLVVVRTAGPTPNPIVLVLRLRLPLDRLVPLRVVLELPL